MHEEELPVFDWFDWPADAWPVLDRVVRDPAGHRQPGEGLRQPGHAVLPQDGGQFVFERILRQQGPEAPAAVYYALSDSYDSGAVLDTTSDFEAGAGGDWLGTSAILDAPDSPANVTADNWVV